MEQLDNNWRRSEFDEQAMNVFVAVMDEDGHEFFLHSMLPTSRLDAPYFDT